MAKQTQLVLIDDDDLVRMTWEMTAKGKGHVISTYSTPEAVPLDELDRETPMYVDWNLGDNRSGVDVIRNLLSLGFSKVYLATGMPSVNVPLPEGLSGIQDKTYPL